MLWEDAYVSLTVPDLRSVSDAQPLEWNGRGLGLAPENLIGWSQNLTSEAAAQHGVTRVEKDELLRQADVVSVHLDFLRAGVRARQVARMVEVLAPRGRPLVVMGDFNAEWHDESSAVQRLADSLGLVAHAPEVRAHTFPAFRARLDWILVSPQLAFERHEVLSDVVSDHLPVIADLSLRR